MGVVGGRLKREGIYVYLQLIHVVAEDNITLLSNYLPIKNKFEKIKNSSKTFSFHVRKEASLEAKLWGLSKVWKLILWFIFIAYTHLHSHQQVPEARMASGFPYRGKREGSTKTRRDPSNRVGGRSGGVHFQEEQWACWDSWACHRKGRGNQEPCWDRKVGCEGWGHLLHSQIFSRSFKDME